MEKSVKDHLTDTLDDMSQDQLKKFKDKLCDRRTTPRVRRGTVEKASHSTDLANLIVETFTMKHAVDVTIEVLEAIGCNQQAQDLKEATEICSSVLQPVKVDSKSQDVQMAVHDEVDQSDNWQESLALTPCSQQFKDRVLREEGQEIYVPQDKSVRKRLALLITNIQFDNKRMYRSGAEKDEQNMKWLLKQLDYQVEELRNLSGKEMDDAVRKFAGRKEHKKSDSTYVVIMSHGKRDAILGVHYHKDENPSDFFPVDKIFTYLNAKNCPALRDKPKVILIQACRGDEDGRLWVSDDEAEEPMEIEGDDWVHNEKDFIPLMSCTPDTKSYRHIHRGSFYIQCVVEVFSKHAHEDHIEELFRKVMRRFESVPHMIGNHKQMVCKDRVTLTKLFYLFPGL